MAGSISHTINDTGEFIGIELLDTMGDAFESIEEYYNENKMLKDSLREIVNYNSELRGTKYVVQAYLDILEIAEKALKEIE